MRKDDNGERAAHSATAMNARWKSPKTEIVKNVVGASRVKVIGRRGS